ncbi:MAG: signal peptidase [Patescibacteria group bacterium]|jgi:signal peptidase I|nr:signal peptidase [Patescibacteria group bacterium]
MDDNTNPQKPLSDNQIPDDEPTQNTVDGTSIILENEEADEEEKEIKKEGIKGIISTVAILIIAPLIALSLTAFVFQSYEVDGPSMETTLQNKDRLIVYKLPRTLARITGRDYVPERGDIVIFSRNDSSEFGSTKPRQLIKRVIALPGEEIMLKDNAYTVFNKDNPNGFNPDDAPYGKVITTTSGDIARFTVPEDSVFVSGDNRPNSLDSRAFGPVPLNDLIGKLSLRVYPFNKGQKF